MDLSRLRQGELIAAVSAIALFVFMFFAWYGVSGIETEIEGVGIETPGVTANAWESFSYTDLVMLLAIVIAIGVALIAATGASVQLPVAGSALTAGVGALAFLLVLYRLINPPGEVDVDREIGIFLGLIASAGIAVGGYLSMQEEGGPGGGGVQQPRA